MGKGSSIPYDDWKARVAYGAFLQVNSEAGISVPAFDLLTIQEKHRWFMIRLILEMPDPVKPA